MSKRQMSKNFVMLLLPTNVGTTRATPTVAPLVVIRAGVEIWVALVALRVFFSLGILTLALVLGQPITKCTLAILVGYSFVHHLLYYNLSL